PGMTPTLSLHDALPILAQHGLRHCQNHCNARLVIEMPGIDKAVRREFRLRLDRDRIANIDAEGGRPPVAKHLFVEPDFKIGYGRSEEHTSELQSRENLV